MEEHGYTVIRALGQGGCQCRVYEVRNREGRLRVVKQLPWIGESDRESAMREVRLLSSLRHPCIVAYLESFLIKSTPSMPSQDVLCLVMSRCERDLRQECLRLRLEWELEHDPSNSAWTQNQSQTPAAMRFEESQVLSWLAQLCWGLQHLHARKLLHRDLKPQNVLLSHGGRRAMLADFGVAGQVEHTEDLKHSIVGTPAFMSPEMLEGRPYGFKTDQWALGCVLYEMMSLEPPFAGARESYASVVSAVLNASPVRAPPGYSSELSLTVERLLAKKPFERPSNRELLRSSVLRVPFHTFVQNLDAAAASASATQAGYDQMRSSGHQRWSRSTTGAWTTARALASSGIDSVTSSRIGTPGPESTATGVHLSQARGTSLNALPLRRSSAPFPGCSAQLPGGSPEAFTPSDGNSPVPPRGGSTPAYSTQGSFGSAFPSTGGILGRLDSDADVEICASDFELVSAGGSPAPANYPVDASAEGCTNGQVIAAMRTDFTTPSSGCGSVQEEPAPEALGSVDIDIGDWQQLLAEAESLLQPAHDYDVTEEARLLRESLSATLGTPERADWALCFLRERRPLGDTIEADELLLQVELLDLLGEEGVQTLPILERLIAIEENSIPDFGCKANASEAYR